VSGWLAELALILLAWGVFASAASAALSLGWPALAAALPRLEPTARARAALALALAPALVPWTLVALCLAPGVPPLIGWHADHCLMHTEHVHLCLTHHDTALSAPLVALLASAAAISLAALVRLGSQLGRARLRWIALRRTAVGTLAPGVTLVRCARPFSVAAGLLRPHVWVSTALADALPADQLEAVIEHERGHVRGRDALCRLIAGACALPLWPRVRRALLAELALASEEVCDEVAGARIGDRLRVAETILAVERLLGANRPAEPTGFLAFGGSTVPDRVRSLLATPPAAISASYAWAGAAVLAVAAWVGCGLLHHATEHLINALLHAL
jgi:Zn-dependent protease with chaperone function